MGKWAFDPLGYSLELAHSACFLPLGFPFRIVTNSSDVLRAAGESWGGFPQFFYEAPGEIRVAVEEEPSGEHAEGLVLRGQAHLVLMISDAANFAVCDADKRFAFCRVTAATARDHAWFRYFYLESIVNLLLWQTHLTRIHAGCVARDGRGVLLCGESGAGKSCLAYACARRGWTLVSDEAPSVVRRTSERIVIGKPQQIHLRESAFELFPELRGRPVKPNPVGKVSLELHTAELRGLRTAYRSHIAAVVFLNRREPGPARLSPLDKEEAWRRLRADLPLFEEPAHEEHQASLKNLLEGPVFEMRYRELEEAIEQLERIVF